MAFTKELQEFVDELSGKLHPDEPWNVHLHHIVREGFDVIGAALKAGANVDELSNEAVAAASVLVNKLNIGAIGKRIAATALPWVIPPIVEKLAQYSGTAQEFGTTHVLPRLDEWIATLIDVRAALAPAPATT